MRWKGENISASEVEKIILTVAGISECIVYGKQVANNEGKVGIAAICLNDSTLAHETIENIARVCAQNIHPDWDI